MLPYFKSIPPQSSVIVDKFRGLNITEDYQPGEVTECKNITSSSYPALSSRKKRSVVSECDGIINGVGSFDGFFYSYYVPQTKALYLHFKGKNYEYTHISNCIDCSQKRSFAILENCIVIIPDNIMFFTDSLKFETIDVKQIYKYSDAENKFSKESDGLSSIDTSSHNERGFISHNSIKSHKASYKYAGNYLDFYFVAFDPNIKKGDVLTVKMNAYSDDAPAGTAYSNYMAKMKKGFTAKVKDLEKVTHKTALGIVEETVGIIFDDNTVDTGGFINVYFTDITIERKMPVAKAVTAFNNRVWAISKNKIYASKLGEPDEWNDFSVDSYGTLPTSSFAASAGSEGDFTAIIPHGNYIYAFKENKIHKIYGDTPDEFTVSGMEAPGAVINDTACICGSNLMYVSYCGVCVLRDGYPRVVSQKIGTVSAVCASSHNAKYYLICHNDGDRAIYVYDTEKDIWTMEDCENNADNLCGCGENLYYSSGSKLICISDADGDEYEKTVAWSFCLRFEPGSFGPGTAIRATARIKLDKNASFTVRATYDDDTIGAVCGFCFDETPDGCADLRMPIKRELGFYLVFRGVGGFTLRNIKFNYYKSDTE